MSKTVDLRWELEQRRRREEYLGRIQSNVERFRHRYQEKFDDLVSQGLEEFMPQEFSSLRDDLYRLASLSVHDPEHARDLSFKIGEELSQLPRLARSAKFDFAERERVVREKLKESRRQASSALSQFIHDMITEITDPIELDFVYEEIQSIQSQYAGRIIDSNELAGIQINIRKKFQIAREAAQEKVSDWKKRKACENEKADADDLIELYKEQASADLKTNPEAIGGLMKSLDEMRKLIDSGKSIQNVQESIVAAVSHADEEVVDEACRRKVVRSIMDSLQMAGFVVSRPKRNKSGNDEVIISARKPAGSEAAFRVSANGQMIYKFDHYEGMTCKEDIQKVLPMLKDIYGVNLSDERIVWENPDRISKSAKPLSDGQKEYNNGKN